VILGFGAMLGKLVAESGAAQRITSSLVNMFGLKRIQWAVMLTGFIVGIPMFYAVGFVILVPIIFTLAASTELPLCLWTADDRIPFCHARFSSSPSFSFRYCSVAGS